MTTWKTKLHVGAAHLHYQTEHINIKRGIYQGDSLSPLWFCLALNPLSHLLNSSPYAYKINKEEDISHQFYVDDLKLYAKGRQQLHSLLEIVSTFSKGIKMEFGLSKCAAIHVVRGKVEKQEHIELTDGSVINNLEGEYKYLGFAESFAINQKINKEQYSEKMTHRLKTILKTQLTAKNKINAINTWVMPTITYTFGVLAWTPTDIQALDRKIRTLLTKYIIHHPKSAIERLYLPRCEGGRGLTNLELALKQEKNSLCKYFNRQNHPSIRAIIQID